MSTQQRLTRHGLICFGIFAAITGIAVFSSKIHLGFFGYFAMLVFGTLFTTLGVSLGDAFRRFTRPDVLVAADSVDMFRKRVFWKVGPQAIGWIIGFIAFQGMMRNVLGFAV
ncbi:MAG: hypothetical protein ACM3VY_00710 [Candidatus Bathyarchaeota archaeon]